MELLNQFKDIFLHLDKHMNEVVNQYGTLTYLILFLIIFVETGLVIMPFLPGDSLLFAAGAVAAISGNNLNILYLMGLLIAAAFLGDTLNYWIGKYFGMKLFSLKIPFLKKEYLDQTHAFYEKHGGKTIIIARFVPIVRTFAPFVGGMGSMDYKRFISYNLIGGIVWVVALLSAGYFFGNIEIVKKNFSLVVLGIIFLSILPPIIEFLKAKFSKSEARA
ncbi:MAG: DedA family protein [Bacteroidota bacterium]